jgi:hypothetical protein
MLFRRRASRISVEWRQALVENAASIEELMIAVSAINKGRAAITIESWFLELPDKFRLVLERPESWQPKLPYRLEPKASVKWHYPNEQVRRDLARYQQPADTPVRAGVQSGSEAIYGQWPFLLADTESGEATPIT